MINEREQFRYEEDIDYVSEVSKTKDEFLDRSMPKHLIFTRSITTSCLHLTLDKDSRYCDARSIIRFAPQLSPFDRIDRSNICLVAVIISIEMVFLYTIIGILLDNAMIKWNKKLEKKQQ